MSILYFLAKVYFFLSLCYTIVNFERNVAYHYRHAEYRTKAIMGAFTAILLSLVFGGVSLISQAVRTAKKKFQEWRAWYHLAKTARELTKTIENAFDDHQEKSK